MAVSPSSEFAGVVITGTGQTGEVVCCFSNATGAVTDQVFTRNDTNAALTAKDGHRIRVIGMQIFGGNTSHTARLNSKPSSGSGVAITPTMIAANGSINSIDVGAIGLCTTRENETLTMTTSGDVSIQVQVIIEPVYNVVQTIPVTNPSTPPTADVDFDPTRLIYTDNGLTLATVNLDPIYRWDAIGAVYSAVQTTLANRPILKTLAFNGKPAVEFVSSDFMPISGSLFSLVNGTNKEFTLFMVVKHINATGNQTVLGFGAAGANPKYQFGTNTNTYIAHKTDDAGTVDNFTGAASDPTVKAVLSFVVDNSVNGTLSFFRRVAGDIARATDAATGTNATFNSGALTASNATLGALTSGGFQSNYAAVQVARILIYNTELSAEQRAYVENQLIQTYL